MTVPTTILTGFLGAGKTTLLNHALRDPALAHTLVVVNEFGAIPLDHLIVREVREEVVLLDSGCVCCSVRGDLVETLLREATPGRRPRFNRVLVETTGLADPTPIIATLVRHQELIEHFHLDSVVTAVDTQLGSTTLREQPEARKQVELADDLILTKTDLVDSGVLDETRTAARALNPHARMFSAEQGVVDWKPILTWNASTTSSRLVPPVGEHSHSGAEIQSFGVSTEEVVDFRAFAFWLSMVTQFYGDRLLRVKALLRLEDESGPVVMQSVQHVVYPVFAMEHWPTDDRSSRVMVITRGLQPTLVADVRSTLRRVLGGAEASEGGSTAP